MRRTFVLAVVLAAASLAPIAAVAHPARVVEHRTIHVADARAIRAAEARIRRLVFEARRDGFVTRRERARIGRHDVELRLPRSGWEARERDQIDALARERGQDPLALARAVGDCEREVVMGPDAVGHRRSLPAARPAVADPPRLRC